MDIATEIKVARIKLGLTQGQASKNWGVPVSTLRDWEQGQHQPRGLALTKLREILDSAKAEAPAENTPEKETR